MAPPESMRLVERISAKSWSSEATQNTGTTARPRSSSSCRATRIVARAFHRTKSGPPKRPACWPVTIAVAPGSARARARCRRSRRPARLLLARERPGHGRHRPLEAGRALGGGGDRREVEAARAEEGGGPRASREVVEEQRGERLVERVVRHHVGGRSRHGSSEDSTAATRSRIVTWALRPFDGPSKRARVARGTGECRQRSDAGRIDERRKKARRRRGPVRDRPLPDHGDPRLRRDGGRLQGLRPPHQAHAGDQDDPPRHPPPEPPAPGLHRALLPGGAHLGDAVPPEHRDPLRHRGGERRSVPRHGARGRQDDRRHPRRGHPLQAGEGDRRS